MTFKYLQISDGGFVWGIHELTKERFVSAVNRGDTIINTEDGTQFDKDKNAWVEISGDEK